MERVRMAVVGAGSFGRHHLRVIAQSGAAQLTAVVDSDRAKAEAAAAQYRCQALTDWRDLAGVADAASVAVPTVSHAEVGLGLMNAGLDVLIEKPLAPSREQARQLVDAASRLGRILQVGHLERFNPAVAALRKIITVPLFFEIHRLNLPTQRSLDVDVVLDLMIHDVDLVLALTGLTPDEVRAAGISILSPKVDIANVRLAFPGGCVANLTASRVSTERVRKLRLFQPHQYISLDYERQSVLACSVSPDRQIAFEPLTVENQEPLRLELEHFFECVRTRRQPEVDGAAAARALDVSLTIMEKIEEHAGLVQQTLENRQSGGDLER